MGVTPNKKERTDKNLSVFLFKEIIMDAKDDLVVEGYHFATLADAETARLDAKRIKKW